ncbi:hypothetical protein GR217_34200 [Rhizobium leguminosarum]|uniref:Uncharacterized protein n=1 Tax=Rhizobium ruizarguesonis TaxID=2081791 RepID=A0AAE4Z0B4_9HYPH|nr:hypothetical protein [Rhizobium ruizarguesonis]NEI52672.1 hypothetical protein [Rhizobium ruizarguesonis]
MKPVFDNSSLIDFLTTQEPAGTYDYYDGDVCLVAKYLHYRGFNLASVDTQFAYLPSTLGAPRILPAAWDDIARETPWTFGAALERARKVLK